MGLTPTTSTAMMLALGDALAVALLERRGFSAENFQLFHPGGSIGRKLLRVRDIMHIGEAIPLVAPEAAMSEAILVMTAKSFGCVGVRGAGGRLVGIITDGDLRRHMTDDLFARRASEVMHAEPRTIAASGLAAEALGTMNRLAITALFVVDAAKPSRRFSCIYTIALRAGVA